MHRHNRTDEDFPLQEATIGYPPMADCLVGGGAISLRIIHIWLEMNCRFPLA